jgi:radical SAM superfamily enzyme YgiQ (UPF0313 family)
MLNHFTAARKPRRQDHYSPGGKAGLRPDRATMVYTNTVRRLLKGVPVVIGGVEASLRRLALWDHWSNTFRRSILLASKAEALAAAMAASIDLRPYACDRCGRYHLTSRLKGKRRLPRPLDG